MTRDGRYLNEAVVEEDPEEAGGQTDVAVEHRTQVGADDGLEVVAGAVVEFPRQPIRQRRVVMQLRTRGDKGKGRDEEEEREEERLEDHGCCK